MFNKERMYKVKKNKVCAICGKKTNDYSEVQLGKSYIMIVCTSCDGASSYSWDRERNFYPKYMQEGLDLYQGVEIPQHVFEYMVSHYWVCGRIGQDANKYDWKFSIEMPKNKPDEGYEWRRPNLFEATQRYIWSQKHPKHYADNADKATWASQNVIPWDEPKAQDYERFKLYKKQQEAEMSNFRHKRQLKKAEEQKQLGMWQITTTNGENFRFNPTEIQSVQQVEAVQIPTHPILGVDSQGYYDIRNGQAVNLVPKNGTIDIEPIEPIEMPAEPSNERANE
jgi:hypothetical protein